ncbi:MAG: hypothetical protein ACE5PT_09000 [Gemmatimonadales bacterium]
MYTRWLILIAFAALFYRAAEYERMSPWPWALSSAGLTWIVGTGLRRGVMWMILAQVGLFAVMTWYNGYRKRR